jgi:hypothetical protein
VTIPIESVAIAKKGLVQLPVSNGAPLNVAVAGVLPMKLVNSDSVMPVTVTSSEFDVPRLMLIEVAEAELADV